MNDIADQSSSTTQAKFSKYLEYLGISLCVLCSTLSIVMTFQNRTLWPDEAMLVWNLETRTLSELAASPLDMCQTAPLIYLYCLKCFSLVLGHAEWAYRLPSALAYVLLPVMVWWVARHLFHLMHPWLCAGFCANLKLLLIYSNQVKPYIGEAGLVLLVLTAYDYYLKGKLSWWNLAGVWVLLGLCGNPVWFAVAGCLVWSAFRSIRHRDASLILHCLGTGAIFGICMVFYWLFWLSPVAHSSGMQDYWCNQMLRWPFSLSAILHDGKTLWILMATQSFGARAFYLVPLLIGSIFLVIKEKHCWGTIMWLAMGCACGASCLNMFPISMRLWVFSLPFVSLLAFWTVETFARACRVNHAGILLAVMAIANLGIVHWNPSNNFIWGRELNYAIAYVQEHLREGESVFFPGEAFARVQYKNGIWNQRLGNTSQDNIIFGGLLKTDEAIKIDLERIESTGTCWLPMANRIDSSLIEQLSKNGTIENKHEFMGTLTSLYRNDKNILK